MEDLLIEAVKARDCLYNYNHPMYKNFKHKEAVWDEVAETVGENVKKCKKKWKCLRDSARRVYYTPSANPATKEKWHYAKSLRFLKEYVKPPKTVPKYTSLSTVTMFDEKSEEVLQNTIVNPIQSFNSLVQDHEDRKKETSASGGIYMFLQNLGEKIMRANFTDDEELEIQEALIGTLRTKMMEIKSRNEESKFCGD